MNKILLQQLYEARKKSCRFWLQVIETRSVFLIFKFSKHFMDKKTLDTDGNKVDWFHIRWIRYEKMYSVLQFKYNLNSEEPFRVLGLRHGKRGRSKNKHHIQQTEQIVINAFYQLLKKIKKNKIC